MEFRSHCVLLLKAGGWWWKSNIVRITCAWVARSALSLFFRLEAENGKAPSYKLGDVITQSSNRLMREWKAEDEETDFNKIKTQQIAKLFRELDEMWRRQRKKEVATLRFRVRRWPKEYRKNNNLWFYDTRRMLQFIFGSVVATRETRQKVAAAWVFDVLFFLSVALLVDSTGLSSLSPTLHAEHMSKLFCCFFRSTCLFCVPLFASISIWLRCWYVSTVSGIVA